MPLLFSQLLCSRFHQAASPPCRLDVELSDVYDKDYPAEYRNNQSTEQPIIDFYENGAMGLTFSFRTNVEGDVNGDGVFSISDAVLLQRWLLGQPKSPIKRWQCGDLCKDGRLDSFDLCLMKQALVQSVKLPTSVTIHEGGGFEGVSLVYSTYEEDGSEVTTCAEMGSVMIKMKDAMDEVMRQTTK
ncbi:MAG: dockerin type I repeat-containing protein [Ruminococcus sp.]|nr:dockerin type I repeat-containing protein [Ruminococcus sp.]